MMGWGRRHRHNQLLKVMRSYGEPMTVELLTRHSRYTRAQVLRFRDWAIESHHIIREVQILGPGHAKIWYSINPLHDDSY